MATITIDTPIIRARPNWPRVGFLASAPDGEADVSATLSTFGLDADECATAQHAGR